MWAIRILNGPQAGLVFQLTLGRRHMLGRGPTCDLKIASTSVSKEHATVMVTEDKVFISDMNSRNGTFVNGIRIQNSRLNAGDKISLNEILLEILSVPDQSAQAGHRAGLAVAQPHAPAAPAWAGNAAVRLQSAQMHHTQPAPQDFAQNFAQDLSAQMPNQVSVEPAAAQPVGATDLLGHVQLYLDNVAMPGIYALAKSLPFRWALALLVGAFILVTTTLSLVPVVQTTKHNIQAESIRRARTIARNIRDYNRRAITEHNDPAVDVHAAELEEGIKAAFVINAKDGTIIAPANQRGEYANKPFVNEARREERELVQFIDDSVIGVSVPIASYNAETGNQAIGAYAIVLYDTGALAMSFDQELSLFIQTLAIALVAGTVLFFFLYKVVEQPLLVANQNLDEALREGRDDLRTEYQFPPLEQLISNINSALSRIGRGGEAMPAAGGLSRDIEATNLVRILPMAAVTVSAIDERVIATNSAFDNLVGGGLSLAGRPLNDIPDVALQQNLADLIPRMRSVASEIALSQIPFSGEKFEICGQAMMGSVGPEYFLITLARGGDS